MQKFLPACGAVLALAALLVGPDAATALEIKESVSQPPGLGGKVSGSMAKADTALRRVFAEFQAHAQRGGPEDFAPSIVGVRYARGRILVDAVADADAEQLLGDLRGLGLRNGAHYGNMVSGMVPLAAVERMVGLDSLRSVRVSWKPITNAHTAISEVVAAMRADLPPASAYDGTGITVGVLSDSYDHLDGAAASQAAGDLPAIVTVLEDGGCNHPAGNCTDEGRAMMELVHDIAPGADGAFHSAFLGLADFANGIEELAATGSDVIVDDVLYFAEPMFQDGLVAKAVDTVVGQGVAYFSSAGNAARQSYESPFVQALDGNGDPEHLYVMVAYFDPSCPGFICYVEEDRGILHDFDPDSGIDYQQGITIPPGGILTLVLQWDQPWGSLSAGTGSKSDMDVYLVDAGLNIIVESIDDNLLSGDAIEILQAQNTGTEPETAYLLVTNFTGPEAGILKYVLLGGLNIGIEYPTFSSTTYGHANAAGAESVGAAFYQETPAYGIAPALLEWFSSAGGTPILFGTRGKRLNTADIRQKPEIVAPDGTNTTFFYSDTARDEDDLPNFFGTSAAAPHAAGVAALMLQADASLSPGAIYAAMEDTAEDMGAPGVDFDSGFGLVRADQAVVAVGGNGAAPVADDQNKGTPEDTPVAVTLTGSDLDDDPLTFTVVNGSGPTNGSLSGTAPDLTYTPTANYNGSDSFTYTANDGTENSAPATVSITVDPVNDAPVADAKTVVTDVDKAIDVTLTGSDIDDVSLTFSVVNGSGPTNGSVSGTAPNLTYTPTSGYIGGDSFAYMASDATLNSVPAMVSITVAAPGNDVPTAIDDAYSTAKNETLTLAAPGVLGNDVNPGGGELTAGLVSSASNGTVTLLTDGSFTYKPNKRYTGEDSFIYLLNGDPGNTATVTITVGGGDGGGGGGGGGGKPCNPRKETCS